MEAWVFVVILAVLAVGIGAGFAIGRSTNSAQRRSENLESEITQLREQMSAYRQQVGQHFAETADVVNAMTANYRTLFDHLSKGAQELCGEQFSSNKLDSSAMRFIEHTAEASAAPTQQGETAQGEGAAAAVAGMAGAAVAGTQADAEDSAEQTEESDHTQEAGPSHIADAMEKSAEAERQADQGNGLAEEGAFEADADKTRAEAAGNGEAEAAAPGEEEHDKQAGGPETDEAGEQGRDEGAEPIGPQTVAEADQAKRPGSTTLH